MAPDYFIFKSKDVALNTASFAFVLTLFYSFFVKSTLPTRSKVNLLNTLFPTGSWKLLCLKKPVLTGSHSVEPVTEPWFWIHHPEQKSKLQKPDSNCTEVMTGSISWYEKEKSEERHTIFKTNELWDAGAQGTWMCQGNKYIRICTTHGLSNDQKDKV